MNKCLIVVVLSLFVTVGIAQKKEKTPQEKAAKKTEKMKEVLQLTDQQYATIKSINEKYATDEKAKKKEQKAEIEAVLTPEQKAKWEAYKDEHDDVYKEGKALKDDMDALNLSEDQKQRLRDERQTFKSKKDE